MKFILLLIAVVLKTGLSIYCFDCETEHYPSCKDPFAVGTPDTDLLSKNCAQLDVRVGPSTENVEFGNLPGMPEVVGQLTQDKTICFKAIIEKRDGQLVTSRGCGLMGAKEQCKHITNAVKSKNAKVNECLVCDKNECNSAPRNIVQSITSLMSILIPGVILALRAQMRI